MKKYLLVSVLFISACSVKPDLVQTELYFGLSKADGSIISDSVVNVFIEKNAGIVFPKGYTVIQTKGKWHDAQSGRTYSEPSFVITSSDTMTSKRSAAIDTLREQYKRVFQQQSVLRVDKEVLSIN
jgi:hypothetical protein